MEAPLLPLMGVPTSAPPRSPVVSPPVAAAAPCRAGGRNGPTWPGEVSSSFAYAKRLLSRREAGLGSGGGRSSESSVPPLPQRSPLPPPPPAAELFALTLCWPWTSCLTLRPGLPKAVMQLCFQAANLRRQGKKEGREEGKGRKAVGSGLQSNIRIM